MLRSLVLVCALAIALVLHGCMGQPACTDSGEDVLIIPVARLASVTGLRAEGTCTVAPVPADCTVATKCVEWRGEDAAVVTVTGTARGKCMVSVDFNDGCVAEVHNYEFIGPTKIAAEMFAPDLRRRTPSQAAARNRRRTH